MSLAKLVMIFFLKSDIWSVFEMYIKKIILFDQTRKYLFFRDTNVSNVVFDRIILLAFLYVAFFFVLR